MTLAAITSDDSRDCNWFDSEVGRTYQALNSYIDTVMQTSKRRFTDYVRFAALYGNLESVNFAQIFLNNGLSSASSFRRLSFNICSSMTDTVTNQRASEAPDILSTSADGDYRQFVRAKLLTEAIRAEFRANDHDAMFPRVVQNACVFGNGLATVDRANGRLNIRRLFTPELVVDPYDNTCDGWPHTVSHVRFVNRFSLSREYPEHADKIREAAAEPNSTSRTRGEDNVRVVESWTMAQGGKPGKHACVISTCDLIELEDYPYEDPPIVDLPWGLPFQGWYAQGLVEQLVGLQLEINDTLEIIHEAVKQFSHPFMLIEAASNVNHHHIQDLPGRLLKYTNTKPEIVAPGLLSPEVYAHLERCYQKAYEIAGVNMYAAQAKTLPRYESSKAMRAAEETGEVRHFNFGKACERYHLKLAALISREGAILADETDYKTRLPHSQYFRNIPWREIAYDVDNYAIEIEPVNKGANSIASSIQDLEDLAQLQQLSVAELRRYLLNPDIKRVLNHITASDEYIDWVIYKLAYEETWVQPEMFMDFATAFKECVAEYLRALRVGISKKAKENLLNYILALKAEMDAQRQEAMVAQAKAASQGQAEAMVAAQAKQQQQSPMMGAPAQPQAPLNQPGSQQ